MWPRARHGAGALARQAGASVVPFAAGGSTDVVARMIGQKLSVLWGQPFVVENRADAARIEINHVPYRGEALAYNDLMAGQIQMMVGNFAAATALLGLIRLRALAVIGKQRSQQLPNGPTVAESGLPGFENTGWFGFLAPVGTPPVGNMVAELAKAMDAESRLWATVVKNRNIITNCHEEKTDEN